MKRLTQLVVLVGATFLVSATAFTKTSNVSDGLIVHEWGTFTSIAGENGSAVAWQPLDGPSDLPCFVDRMTLNLKASLSALVRMETPVLYFYAPRQTTVNVGVRFHDGLVTEWFPKADVVRHGGVAGGPILARGIDTTIEWAGVKISPDGAADFRTGSVPSHYYAARRTDAAPLAVSSQHEKFLFYRGVGDFAPPISAKVSPDGDVVVTNLLKEQMPVIRFENRGGEMGYQVRTALDGQAVFQSPVLDAEVGSPEQALEKMLIASGLYMKEAKAMIETWHDSWFEEGARLFYILPQSAVDQILPLDITPRPAQIVRVFVGRVELVTSEIEKAVEEGIATNDRTALEKFGRFLEPIVNRIASRSAPADRLRGQNLLQSIRSASMAASLSACR